MIRSCIFDGVLIVRRDFHPIIVSFTVHIIGESARLAIVHVLNADIVVKCHVFIAASAADAVNVCNAARFGTNLPAVAGEFLARTKEKIACGESIRSDSPVRGIQRWTCGFLRPDGLCVRYDR